IPRSGPAAAARLTASSACAMASGGGSISRPRRHLHLRGLSGLRGGGARRDPRPPHPDPGRRLRPHERAAADLPRRPRRPPDGLPITFLLARSQPDREALEDGEDRATHLRYFPQFGNMVAKVEETLAGPAGKPRELITLAGEYRELTL